ncbi:Eukaryotic translation initiation factor eIF-1 [Coemansia sp. RSA 1813]|nr:Eukaryotic translation initiation factor eIF-1 [Coemansia sp. RSA 1646]KAJ1771699.1 Eukaryotic translation initiation factor eIF-1 [Coemansia sp. RSA 1843]KAJ2089665.1 Eukaryotic translation initiation factor eIF-1 [Coemansia sp. RSA 986]KAJ2214140.1 Eukaryotic translation initiation factor eIF-1 [Coemansia sp. RSA 487]KAJ2569198.1 Eukaryotic translation initiation factor eIF-1 [Coemansia sp. RSA 1813]
MSLSKESNDELHDEMNLPVEASPSTEHQDVEKSKKKKKSKKSKEVADEGSESEASGSDSEGEEKKKKKKSKKKSKKSLSSKADEGDLEAMMANDGGAFVDPFDNKEQFGAMDPFDETTEDKETGMDHIHLRIKQRRGRKMLTTIQGLPEIFDYKKLVKYFKNTFACMGTIINDETYGKAIQLSGDQRLKVREFLIGEEIATADTIKVHGF